MWTLNSSRGMRQRGYRSCKNFRLNASRFFFVRNGVCLLLKRITGRSFWTKGIFRSVNKSVWNEELERNCSDSCHKEEGTRGSDELGNVKEHKVSRRECKNHPGSGFPCFHLLFTYFAVKRRQRGDSKEMGMMWKKRLDTGKIYFIFYMKFKVNNIQCWVYDNHEKNEESWRMLCFTFLQILCPNLSILVWNGWRCIFV